MWLQSTNVTDRQTTCNRNTALCTKVHRAVIKSDQLFQKATTTELRGHSLKLYKKSSRLELRKHSFSQRIVDHWNKLPDDVVSIRSYHFYLQKETRYLDGQIWALKGDSLTSPLIVTVTVMYFRKAEKDEPHTLISCSHCIPFPKFTPFDKWFNRKITNWSEFIVAFSDRGTEMWTVLLILRFGNHT